MIDVTIIVPVYNTEQYLEKCLDSLVNQNYPKNRYEILLIDDGSHDNSPEIIKKYKKKYSNIVLLNSKENKGVSYSRNIGIIKSRGKYLMFCDSDDTYELDAIKILMDYAKKNRSDFVMADYSVDNDKGCFNAGTIKYFENNKINKKEIISYMSLTSCSKLIKKELFINNNIFYSEDVKRCEELPVIPIVAYLSKNPMVIDQSLYHYFQRKKSASNSNVSKNENDILYFDITFDRFKKLIDSKYFDEIEFRAIDHLLYGKSLVILKSKMKRRILYSHLNMFKKNYPFFIKNKYLKKYSLPKKIFIYCLNYKMIFLCKIYVFLHKKMTG